MLEFPAGCHNERVFAAQHSRRRRRALVNELGAYAYRFPHCTLRNLDEDVPGDFYLYCHDKLGLMIDQFEDRGVPFEHYVNSVLKWQLRTFLGFRRRDDACWQDALHSHTWGRSEGFTRQQLPHTPSVASARVQAPKLQRPRMGAPAPTRIRPAPLRLADPAVAPGSAGAPRSDVENNTSTARPARPAGVRRLRYPHDSMRRRMLFVLLKTAHVLDTREYDALAAATGCHPDSLSEMISRLSRLRKPARKRWRKLIERRNLAFADLHLWSSVACVEPEPHARARALAQAERHRYTLYRAQDQLTRVRLAPSNGQIARALGVPKGTVDTSLNWLRRNNAVGYLGGGEDRDGVGAGKQQSA